MIDIFGDISSISIESFPEDVEMPSGLFHNGIWRKTSNKVGTFTHKVSEVPLNLGLTKDCEVAFERNDSIPKPPISIFYSLLDFYKEVYKNIASEVYTLLVWDTVAKDYFLHVPQQTVSGSSVKYTNDDNIFNNSNYVVYADFHSHGAFNAFFSTTDIEDEKAGRYFGVIGKVNQETSEYVLKASFNKQFIDLNLEDLFDTDKEKLSKNSNYTLSYSLLKHKIIEEIPVTMYSGKPNAYGHVYNYNDYEDGLYYSTQSKLNNSNNLLKNTIFEYNSSSTNKFFYDFQRLFKKQANNCFVDQEVANIFNSFSELIFDNFEISEDLIDKIILEISSSYTISIENDL